MDFLESVVRFVLLFVEVFCLFLTMLFLIGATMETSYAGIGFAFAIGGLVYAYVKRHKLDLIDRYFYYLLGVMMTYAIVFFTTR